MTVLKTYIDRLSIVAVGIFCAYLFLPLFA